MYSTLLIAYALRRLVRYITHMISAKGTKPELTPALQPPFPREEGCGADTVAVNLWSSTLPIPVIEMPVSSLP